MNIQQITSYLGLIGSCSLIPFIALQTPPVQAQLIPDQTLDGENSVIVPNGDKTMIQGGADRGNALFHSFQEFNVNLGQQVYFANPGNITDILTRVTGTNISEILGTLGVDGSANLFLINPNGIIFGENAQLDITGSFYATTAPSLLLDHYEFSAVDPTAPPLLTLNITPGLQTPQPQRGDITNQGQLSTGQDLTLVGNNLTLQGQLEAGNNLNLIAQDTLTIQDDPLAPFVAMAENNLTLQGTNTLDIFALNHEDSGLFSGGNLTLLSNNPVLGDAHYYSGGDFRILSPDTGALGDLESPDDPIIRAAGDVSLNSYTGASLHILAGGKVEITGDVTITGADGTNGLEETVTLSDGTTLEINGKTTPTLDIRAGTTAYGTPGCTGCSFTLGDSPSSADITIGGDILNNNPNSLVFLSNQYAPNPDLTGTIQVNDIITSVDSMSTVDGGAVVLEGRGDVTTNVINSGSRFYGFFGTGGKGGNVTINAAGTITTGVIEASTNTTFSPRTQGGGEVRLRAGENIVTGDIDSRAFTFPRGFGAQVGSGGDITLSAEGTIQTGILDSSTLAWSIGNADKGGEITVNAGSHITTGDVVSVSLALDGENGEGGAVTMHSSGGNLTVGNIEAFSQASQRFNSSSSAANGGIVNLSADGDLTVGNITTTSESRDIAQNGGTVRLTAGKNLTTGNIHSSSLNAGDLLGTLANGGDIELTAGGDIQFGEEIEAPFLDASGLNGGDISIMSQLGEVRLTDVVVNSNNSKDRGDGGDLTVTGRAVLLDNSTLTTTVAGEGNAGKIQLQATDNLSLNRSRLFTSLDLGAVGEGGNIALNAPNVTLSDFSLIDTATFGEGNAGRVTVKSDRISLSNSSILSLTSGIGNAGNVTINADTIQLNNSSNISTAATAQAVGNGADLSITGQTLGLTGGSQLQALTRGQGKSGNITLNLQNRVNLDGISPDGYLSGIFTTSEGQNSLEGGDITVNTNTLTLNNGAVFSAETTSAAAGGDITVNGQTLNLFNGGQLLTNTSGTGQAGAITVNGSRSINISGEDPNFATRPIPRPPLRSNVPTDAPHSLTKIEPNNTLETAQFLGEELFSLAPTHNPNPDVEFSTRIPYASVEAVGDDTVDYYTFEADAGTRGIFDIDYGITDNSTESVDTELILYDAQGNVLASNDSASPVLGAEGSLSDSSADAYLRYVFTRPDTYTLEVRNGLYNTNFEIDFGDTYTLQLSLESPNLSGTIIDSNAASGLFARSTGQGNAGTITINTPQLNLAENAQITASTVNGQGSGVTINTDNFTLDNAKIDASTTGGGNSGNININARQTVDIIGTGYDTLQQRVIAPAFNDTLTIEKFDPGIITVSDGAGTAGNITITTPIFHIHNGGLIATTALDTGDGGDITLNSDEQFIDNSLLATGTFKSGASGQISLNARHLTARGGAQALTSTFGTGQAGDLNVNVTDTIELLDPSNEGTLLANGLFAASSRRASGNGGDINIKTGELNIRERAAVSVSAEGTGDAGDINVEARSLFMDNGAITATSASGQGGNINLKVAQDVIMRHNSQISTRAGIAGGGGDGGNINISARFIAAVPTENSDITANAFEGKGGNIHITAQAIFGLQVSDKLTPNSDISASSQLGIDGTISINTLNTDPAQGLAELPTQLSDPADQISSRCHDTQENRFVVTGQGGIPENPGQPLRGRTVWQDTRLEEESRPSESVSLEELETDPVGQCFR